MNVLDRGRSEEERREKPEPTGAFLALAIDTLTIGMVVVPTAPPRRSMYDCAPPE